MSSLAFFFRKVAEAALMPIAVVLALGFCGLLFRKRVWTFVSLCILALLSSPLVANRIIGILDHRTKPMQIVQCPISDAVVPLSGDQLRFETAVDLMLANRARLLILTSAKINPWSPVSHGEYFKEAAVQRGIDPESIVVTRNVLTTADEALEVARIVRDRNLHSVVLVTSAVHMPRAVMLFHDSGLTVVPFACDYRSSPAIGLLPSAIELQKSEIALHELFSLALYAVERRVFAQTNDSADHGTPRMHSGN